MEDPFEKFSMAKKSESSVVGLSSGFIYSSLKEIFDNIERDEEKVYEISL